MSLINLPGASSCPPPTPAMSFGIPGVWNENIYPWQQTSTCNITNIAMVAQANMSTTVQQDSDNSQSNTMILQSGGDIVIDHSHLGQTNSYSGKSMQAAFVSNSAQQQMMLQMIQQASSTTKGLAVLPQNAQATNVINGYMKATINMSTNVSQTCQSSESNTMVLQAGGDIKISDSYLSQDNTATMTCMQATATKNVASQSLSAQLEQIASAKAVGIPMWAFFLIIAMFVGGFFAIGYEMTANPSTGVIIAGIIFMIVGVILLGNGFRYDKEQAVWVGFSPGIQNAETDCKSMYRTDILQWQSSSDEAQSILMKKKNKSLAAFDWVPDPDGPGGTAQWYKYSSGSKISTKDLADKCQSVVLSTNDTSNKLISMRPDAYLNVALAGQKPDINIVADLILDIDTGNMWVRMPPGFDTCNPSSYGGAADAQWVFVAPKSVNISNVNNVYKSISNCSGCGDDQTCCVSGCTEAAITDPTTQKDIDVSSSKVYIYIDPQRTLNYNLNATYNYGTGTYMTMLSTVTSLTGKYLWDYSSPLGNKSFESKVGPNDYFLVVFPYGPTADSSYFGTQNQTWPTTATEFEAYDFGQRFYLYKAVPDDPKSKTPKYIPFTDATIPPQPINIVPGLGPSVEVQGFTSTCFKTYDRDNRIAFIIYGCIVGLGMLLLVVGLILSRTVYAPPEQIEPVVEGGLPHEIGEQPVVPDVPHNLETTEVTSDVIVDGEQFV